MLKAFSIKDEKAGLYNTPFFDTSVVNAIRNVIRASEEKESTLNKFTEDFSLYQIAIFNEDNGDFNSVEPIKIGTLTELTTNHVAQRKDFE